MSKTWLTAGLKYKAKWKLSQKDCLLTCAVTLTLSLGSTSSFFIQSQPGTLALSQSPVNCHSAVTLVRRSAGFPLLLRLHHNTWYLVISLLPCNQSEAPHEVSQLRHHHHQCLCSWVKTPQYSKHLIHRTAFMVFYFLLGSKWQGLFLCSESIQPHSHLLTFICFFTGLLLIEIR